MLPTMVWLRKTQVREFRVSSDRTHVWLFLLLGMVCLEDTEVKGLNSAH